MDISVELSFYPLRDEFIPAIEGCIAQLNRDESVRVETNSMSTQLFGEFDTVMALVKGSMKYSFENYGTAIFAAKFLHRAPGT